MKYPLNLLDIVNYPLSVHYGEIKERSVCGCDLIHRYDDNPIMSVNIHIIFQRAKYYTSSLCEDRDNCDT